MSSKMFMCKQRLFFYRVHGYVSHKINVIDILKDIQLQRCWIGIHNVLQLQRKTKCRHEFRECEWERRLNDERLFLKDPILKKQFQTDSLLEGLL